MALQNINKPCFTLKGRYITDSDLQDFYQGLSLDCVVKTQGYSSEHRPIYSLEIGSGVTRILMWSQMHGNESTTTKAVVELVRFLDSDHPLALTIKKACRLVILPMVNPDGAFYYTRENANKVDLNRDAMDASQLESLVLHKVFEDFIPDFAFNLHDQRTIYGVADSTKSACLSLEAPKVNQEAVQDDHVKDAKRLIVGLFDRFKDVLPDHMACYSSGFNPNCFGDYFQSKGCATILFEAGHYGLDYQRDCSSVFMYQALIESLVLVATKEYQTYSYKLYRDLPVNQVSFVDVILRRVLEPKTNEVYVVNIQYQEVLCNKEIIFLPIIVDVSKKESKFAHLYLEVPLSFIGQYSDINRLIGKKAVDCIDFGTIIVNDLLKKQ